MTAIDIPKSGIILPKMGSTTKPTSLSSSLFSNVQQRVLALIFGNPERSFYLSEIIRNIGSGTGAVQRELSRLQSSGLVTVQQIGNQKHYRANRESPIFEELHSIVLKTIGLTGPLRQSLEASAHKIKAAFVFGSVAKGTDTARSDIDLMIVGDDLTYTDLYEELQSAENILRRRVNPTLLSPEDWRRKASHKDSTIAKLITQPKIFIFGSETDLHLTCDPSGLRYDPAGTR